jgi:hypothetical protein
VKLRLPILAVVAALLVAGCGGSDNDPGAVALVKNAFSKSIGSANVNVGLSADLKGSQQLNGPVSLKLSGPYKTNGKTKLPSFDWNIAVSGGGANFDGRLTSTGDNVYLGFQGQSYEVGADTVARYNQALAQQSGAAKRKSLTDFGIDPASWVKGAKEEGDANVGGTATKHVSASIDFDKLLIDLNSIVKKAGGSVAGRTPPQLTSSERKQFTDAIKSSSFDIYVGKADGKIRRVALKIDFSVPKKSQSGSGGLKSGTLNFSVQYSNVGAPQTIQAPTNVKPISELLSKLGGASALGGSGLGGSSGGSAGGGGTSSGASPSSKQFQAYSKCLDSAPAGDAAALTRCSQLLK